MTTRNSKCNKILTTKSTKIIFFLQLTLRVLRVLRGKSLVTIQHMRDRHCCRVYLPENAVNTSLVVSGILPHTTLIHPCMA